MRRFLSRAVGRSIFGAVLPLDGLGTGAELRHRRAERPEVVHHRLVDQHVAVGEEQDALLAARLPQPPDDLERGVGLAGAGRHDEQDAVLPFANGLDRRVDGVALVVARRLAAAVVEVVLQDDLFLLGARPFHPEYCAQKLGGLGNESRASVVSSSASARCGRENESRRR